MMSARSPDIEIISLDAGGTMIEPFPSVGAVYARVARERFNHDPRPALLDQRFRAAWKNADNYDIAEG